MGPVADHITRTVAEFTKTIRRTADLEVLRTVYQQTVADLGIRCFAYHVVSLAGVGDHLVHGITTYPDEWVQRYIKMNYVHTDPVVVGGLERAAPFHWNEVAAPELLNARQDRLFREADDFAIHGGFTIPIHSRREFAMMSVVPEGTPREAKRNLAEHQHLIHLLALYYHNHASGILLEEYFKRLQPRLTPRERECLTWIARGKTTWEVSKILGIAERTALYHVENAKHKLGVFSRPHAVVKAAMSGLIEFP